MAGSNAGPISLAAAVLIFGCAGTNSHLAEDHRAVAESSASASVATSIMVGHYSIEIPPGYEARKVSPPMMDFDVYRVMRQGSKGSGCGLYFGNHPSFPKLHWSQEAVETNSDNRTTTAFQRPGAIEGLIKFSGVSYKASRVSPWQLIHYFCDELDDVGMKTMPAMIASIKVVQPHVD